MSRPPPQGAQGAQSGVRPNSAKSEMTKITQNLPALMNMVKTGQLSATQIIQLRQIILVQYKQIILQALSTNRPNPLRELPPALDPTLAWQSSNALVSKAEFERQISAAEKEIRDKLALRGSGAGAAGGLGLGGQAAGGATAGASGAGTTSSAAQVSSGPGTPTGTDAGSPASVPTPTSLPRQTHITTGSSVRPPGIGSQPGQAAVRSGAVRPIPAGLYSAKEMKSFVDMPKEVREKFLAANPEIRARFQRSLAYWTANGQGSAAQVRSPAQVSNVSATSSTASTPPGTTTSTSHAGQAVAGRVPATASALTATTPFVSTAQAGTSTRPPADAGMTPAGQVAGSSTQAAGVPGSLHAPQAQSAQGSVAPPRGFQPPPVMIPRESEMERRKRKVREWLGELGPGLELEVGVDQVLGEVIDSFILEAARGSIRLAKHRKAEKIEVKDAAWFLEKTYGMTVPGFDAHVPERIHLPPEERKRGRVVAPRAARRAVATNVSAVDVGGTGDPERVGNDHEAMPVAGKGGE